MKKILSVAIVSALALSSGAALARTYQDTGRVLEATPIYEPVTATTQQCWTQPVTHYEERPAYVQDRAIGPGTVLGAIVGGVIGHQFGNSTGGRDHGTAAGAVIGGLIGNSVENANRPVAYGAERVSVTQPVQRCRPVQQVSNQLVGYDVRYEYRGREYHTRTAERPGRFIPVNVSMQVRPAAVHY